ncbi:hypothetical protein [Sphingobacterium suaedae]|uniref:LPXTG cell wall anchor domain-containing protein n=1 Tax=Sphingobacterium suaedae TaxID=1686402 RepID=A0ABW5KJC5_9SPHI
MISKRSIPVFVTTLLILGLFFYRDAAAQCAMCSLNAENGTTNGNTQGKGLNDGILFLLAIPYLITVGIGLLWYKKYRKAQTKQISPFEK